MTTTLLIILLLFCPNFNKCEAFVHFIGNFACCTENKSKNKHVSASSAKDDDSLQSVRFALTERQQQFWEVVENGLDDIEERYKSKGENIDRIRQFGRSARGEINPPVPTVEYHEPSEEHVDGLSARPFWGKNEFSWAQQLEDSIEIIQKEFESNIIRQSEIFKGDSQWQRKIMGDGWSAIRLQRMGAWNTENIQTFPQTYKLIKKLNIPLAVRGVCFARQDSCSGVAPHSDGRNFILTHHLGLKVPKGCWIEVGSVRKEWEENKLLTLDTSFTHSTGNPTNDDRYILIIDFWHPELTEAEKAGLTLLYDIRNKFDSGSIVPKTTR